MRIALSAGVEGIIDVTKPEVLNVASKPQNGNRGILKHSPGYNLRAVYQLQAQGNLTSRRVE